MIREDIREGIAETLYTFEYDGWEKLSADGRVMWLARADAIMNKEQSQGVVLDDGCGSTKRDAPFLSLHRHEPTRFWISG